MFAHLHTHTEYSALDGLSKIDDLFARMKKIGQTAIAITDHGSSSGLYEAYAKGKKHGIDVLLGEEFYFKNSDNSNGHLILIAKNQEGLKNLFKLQTLAIENFYYKPRLTLELLKENNEGLICTSACIANQAAKYYLQGEEALAKQHLHDLYSIFGEDFYIELQSSTIDEVIKYNKWLLTQPYKRIITNDVHYVEKIDYKVHELLLCMQQKVKMSSPKRWRFDKNDYWLKSEEEIFEYTPYINNKQKIEMLSNIVEIVEKCKNVEIISTKEYPTPDSTLSAEQVNNLFDEKVDIGVANNCLTRKEINDEFLKDIEKERKVIKESGYAGYFLIVQEYIQWAKKNNILVGDGRGSGAGSKIAYVMSITEVNPQEHNLLFERFLAPGRIPDFDVDFSDIDKVFQHLQEIYGTNSVCRIGAYTRLTCKSLLRKILSAFDWKQKDINEVIAMLPTTLQFTIEDALKGKAFKAWADKNEDYIYYLTKLEGVLDHYGQHPGGVLIYPNITELVPIFVNSDDKGRYICGYDKYVVEELGFVKFDILGLNSLTILSDVLKSLPTELDWLKVDFEDENVYNMLSNGDVYGVFQLSEQAKLIKEQRPKNFKDLIAINALIRPGVCDWNEYMDARLNNSDDESILPYMKETHGLIVYQDQYLLLAQTYADWGIGFSDKHIRKNKDIKNDTELHQKFINDGIENGYSKKELQEVWNKIVNVVAGGYGFNQAHSTSYARLSYQTAYLKYYFPKEFYAAMLTAKLGDFVEISKIQVLLKELNIKLLPPDINNPVDKFMPTEEGIRLPISAIKGLGGSALAEIKRLLPITSLNDFMVRRIPKFVKRTTIYALIKAGVFDFDNSNRDELLKSVNYDGETSNYAVYEKECLGIYLSASPFDGIKLHSFAEVEENGNCAVYAQIDDLTVRQDKNGNDMAFLECINPDEAIRMLMFAGTYEKYKNYVNGKDIFLFGGKKSKNSLLVNVIKKV